jgi:hypothetical protein
MREKNRVHTRVGSGRVPYLYGFIDASCGHMFIQTFPSVLFQLKEHFMVTFQAKALLVLTLVL